MSDLEKWQDHENVAMREKQQIERRLTAIRRACLAFAPAALLAGCGRAPTFNILGSFFPAWLVCMIAGIVLAAAFNRLFAYFKLDTEIVWTIVVYPCLALLIACTLWLIFFS
jgi:hypothetical protein